MKKVLSLLLAVTTALSLTACGGAASSSGGAASGSSSDSAKIEVDKGLMNVEITLPGEFFQETSPEEIQKAAEEEGFKSCVINDDNSVTYTMSKTKHKEVMEKMKDGVDEAIADLTDSENAIPSFQKIEHNDKCSEFTIYVDSEKYGPTDPLASIGFYILGAYYQVFSGVSYDEVDVKISFVDQKTSEVLDSGSFRDMLKNAAGTPAPAQ